MSEMADDARSVTNATNVTKITQIKWLFVILVIFVSASVLSAVSQQAPPAGQQTPAQAQQRPVFRAGTHFVRVDAYPVVDGKIVEGLTPADFEVLEDGKRQAVESFDFVKFEGFTADAERHDPVSQQQGFDMAGDPRYRVFVAYVDITSASTSLGAIAANEDLPRIRQPLVSFMDRIMGNRDLFGFLTSRNSVKDLVLAQKTTVTTAAAFDLWRAKAIDRDESDDVLDGCGLSPGTTEMLKAMRRIDQSYTTLEDLVRLLGSIRQERKSIILMSNVLTRAKIPLKLMDINGGNMPRAGITTGGRVGIGNNDYPGGANAIGCTSEVQRLAAIDFDVRYRELIRSAQYENVSFYPVTPAGLQTATPHSPNVEATYAELQHLRQTTDDLVSLASETDGIAIVNTNDLTTGMKKVADDLAAYYVLGYYTTNTKFDGGIRKITVKLRGKSIRARREYRAPTEDEIAAMARRAATPQAATSTAASGPPAVIGEPAAYRVSRTQAAERVRLLEFVRADRLRVEWPVLAPLDRREARMLDTAGKPMPFDLPVAESPDGKTIVVELALAPFARGGYSIELIAASGGKTEQRRLTFIMK